MTELIEMDNAPDYAAMDGHRRSEVPPELTQIGKLRTKKVSPSIILLRQIAVWVMR